MVQVISHLFVIYNCISISNKIAIKDINIAFYTILTYDIYQYDTYYVLILKERGGKNAKICNFRFSNLWSIYWV